MDPAFSDPVVVPAKVEASPAESFLSTPGDIYPSLFAALTDTGDAMDVAMTPSSLASEGEEHPATPETPADAATPDTEGAKKPVKKRKSWGQVLPEPKTNLPPRKRARTEDEKEQRRVERVLRNRRAAQSSRERKRKEVEALEKRNADLKAALTHQQNHIQALMKEMAQLRRQAGVVGRDSSSLDAFQPSPLTLSTSLFQQSANGPRTPDSSVLDFMLTPEQDGTVNPASLSPALTPVSSSDVKTEPTEAAGMESTTAPTMVATSSDATQHPAAVLCDLQCPSVERLPAWASHSPIPLLVTVVSSVLISALCHPLTLMAGALETRSPRQRMTRPLSFPNSTSTSSSARTPSPRSPTPLSACSTRLIPSLQNLPTSNPILARPCLDATMDFLRLVSEGCDDRAGELRSGSPGIKGDPSHESPTWPDSRPGSSVLREKTPTHHNIVLRAVKEKEGGDL
ncbi:hypothetical protein F4802DRAFT_618741 [Xylaria palmicola]|nr:hypothetical protein F4802DRAFT_618741 [Xylaria palmicola]